MCCQVSSRVRCGQKQEVHNPPQGTHTQEMTAIQAVDPVPRLGQQIQAFNVGRSESHQQEDVKNKKSRQAYGVRRWVVLHMDRKRRGFYFEVHQGVWTICEEYTPQIRFRAGGKVKVFEPI